MYKIAQYQRKKKVRIYAFVGQDSDITEENYEKTNLFTSGELAEIKKSKTVVSIVRQSIFIDDSIYAIKLKLAAITDEPHAFEEMYFFAQTEKQMNPTVIFEKYQTKGAVPSLQYFHLIRNIVDEQIEFDQDKEDYTLEDLSQEFNSTRTVNISLGQFSKSLYCVNPIEVDYSADTELNDVIIHDSHLLLEYPALINNTICVHFAEDIIPTGKAQLARLIISNYFPSLRAHGFSATLSDAEANKLRKITRKMSNAAEDTFNRVNAFNEVFLKRTEELKYAERGLKSVSFTLMPDYDMKIPIDVVFKLIHADQIKPLIKYNFSAKQDNIYRLYSDVQTKSGDKIPHLHKSQIFKLMRMIGKSKSVAVYTKIEKGEMICEFAPSGRITIFIEFDIALQYYNLDEFNDIVKASLLPINEDILPFFEQNGYNIPTFSTISSNNVAINDIVFQTTVIVNNVMNMSDYRICLNSIFNIVFDENESEFNLRFKRVGGYSVHDAQRNFVMEHLKRNMPLMTTRNKVMKSFDLTSEQANELIGDIQREQEQETQLNRRHKMVKELPGFETIVSTDRIGGKITFVVKGINNIRYLDTIPIYIDTWVRLSQLEYKSTYPIENVREVCSGNAKVIDIVPPVQEEEVNDVEGDEAEERERDMDDESDSAETVYDDINDLLNQNKKTVMMFEDSDEEGSAVGGAPKKAKAKPIVANADPIGQFIDGKSLSHPYFFQQRMEDRAKTLFSSMKNDKFKSYSRMCPSSIRRQPVILTTEELNETRKKYPGEYDTPKEVLTYSSNKENPDDPETFHYVCPRYWCLKTNSIISEEDVKAGKCGKILPYGETKVKPGHYVYEFSAPEEHIDENGEYIKHSPGFHKNATGDNKCIPCCYKKFSNKQLERREQCEGVVENKDSEFSLQSEEAVPLVTAAEEQYILGPEKFPLGAGRWGKLPISIQQFFKDVGSECKVNKNNKNKSSCLLRHGVERNEKKSFLACIADALYYAEYDSRKEPLAMLDVKTFVRDKLLNAFNLDSFIEYQNGTLYDNFVQVDRNKNKSFNKVANKYKTTSLYIKTQGEANENQRFFMNALDAYERFCDFLLDDASYIDHTYLWDIICRPNPELFVKGLNLIILNIPDADSTTNIEFVCPTNHYSKEVYDSRRMSLILLSRDDIFEPVYEYKDIETKIVVTKTFSEYDRYLSPGMHSVLTQYIKPLIKEHCAPSANMKIYEYQTPPLLDDLVKMLNSRKYRIESQILNLRGKVIGILARDTKQVTCLIPCYPSAISQNLKKEYQYITDDIWTTYERTIGFLNRWYRVKKMIKLVEPEKCSPKDSFCKVIEDGVIVGFLTNTNQFIQISDPMPNVIRDNIPVIENNNYLIADNQVTTAKKDKIDKRRADYVRNIKLENNFYGAFRGAIRILLNDYTNIAKQKEIIDEIYNPHLLYGDKLKSVTRLLKKLTSDRVQFVDSIEVDGSEIASSCLSVDEEKCNANPSCFYSRGVCGLNLPRINLITPDIDNSVLYYSKLADEMVRYNRIKTFLFQHKNYLLFDTLHYNLRDNEMIILQSLLTQAYFANLVPSKHNIRLMNAYDTANPAEAFKKRPPMAMKDILRITNEVEIVPDRIPIKYVGLKECLLTGSLEITYPPTPYATFQFARDIIRLTINESLSMNEIRDKLAELYYTYADKYKIQIANILIQQGKKTFGSFIKAGTLEIKNMVYTEGYYLTNLDIWLLLDHYKIHSLLISHKHLLETNYNEKQFCFYADVEDEEPGPFLMIVNSAIKIETPPSYKYIETGGEMQLNIEDLRGCISEMYSAVSQLIGIEQYVRSFKPILTTKYVKKRPGYMDAPHQEEPETEVEEMGEPVKINITDKLQIPDLGQTPNEPARKARTRKNGIAKQAEHRHKPHTKKHSPKSDS
jgi:hypothetical protein